MIEFFQVTEDDLPDYLEVVAAKRQELAPGLETGASGEGSEEENAELSINKLKIQLVEGNLDEVEPRAQDWLRLCKERGWRRLQTLVARLLSTLGKMVEG